MISDVLVDPVERGLGSEVAIEFRLDLLQDIRHHRLWQSDRKEEIDQNAIVQLLLLGTIVLVGVVEALLEPGIALSIIIFSTFLCAAASSAH